MCLWKPVRIKLHYRSLLFIIRQCGLSASVSPPSFIFLCFRERGEGTSGVNIYYYYIYETCQMPKM